MHDAIKALKPGVLHRPVVDRQGGATTPQKERGGLMMSSRYYEQDDRYREESDRDYPGQGFRNRDYGRGRGGRGRPLSGRAYEDERYFRSSDPYRTGYDQAYGMSTPRYRSQHPYSRPEYDFGGYYDRGYRRDYRDRYDQSYDRREPEQPDRGWWERMSDEVASWFGDEEAERRRRMDEGNHRGKGPRGYKRSDDRVMEDVNDRLTDYSHLDASDIEVTVIDGVVKLEGWVDSRWAKRSAEDIVETVSGVKDVQNNLRVGRATSESVGLSEPLASTKTRAKGA
jgi:osmotically-inducible protein OsmY